MTTYEQSERTTATRHQDRVGYDRDAAHAILDAALVCHLGLTAPDGTPRVLPMLHVRVGETLYLHGSSGAAAALAARAGVDGEGGGLPVCATVTLVDGVVLARSAMHHSANYRSVVALGTARLVSDADEKSAVLAALVDHVVEGRSSACRAPSAKELAATSVLALPLAEVSVKTRSGGPVDEPEDLALPHWAGVLPLRTVAGALQPAADLVPGGTPPPTITAGDPVNG